MEDALIRKTNTQIILGTAREVLLFAVLFVSSKHWHLFGAFNICAGVAIVWMVRVLDEQLGERSKLWHYAVLVALCLLLCLTSLGSFDNRVDAGYQAITSHMLRASFALPTAFYLSRRIENRFVEIAVFDAVFCVLCFAPALFGLRMTWTHVLCGAMATAGVDIGISAIFPKIATKAIDRLKDGV